MANQYDTSMYPLGSTQPTVTFNNASNFDDAANGSAPSWTDRFGNSRLSLKGMEDQFQVFLAQSGYENPVAYVAGLSIVRSTQTVTYSGELYRPKLSDLPFTTTNWATDAAKFVAIGDAALRQDLADDSGSLLVGTKSSLAGAVARTVEGKLYDYVSLRDFGAVGDGVTDDSNAIDAAIASGAKRILVPWTANGYRTTRVINVDKPVVFEGDGVTPYTALGSPNTRGVGSWFFLDHSGVGFYVNAGLGFSGVEFRQIGTYRSHPTPTGAPFTPTVYDWDIEFDDLVDCKLIDVCLLNPYKGVRVHGQQSRLWVDRLYGHPMKVGMQIDEAYDICRINNVHFWPYWAQNLQVWDYTLANLDAFIIGRCDNHMYVNVFSIFHFRGILIINTVNGTANKLKLTNCDLDRGYHGYVVDSAATGHTAQINNLTVQGETGVTGANIGLAVYANQVDLSISNLDIRNINSVACLVAGTFTNIGIHDLYCSDWNLSDVAGVAFNTVQPSSVVFIDGAKRFYSTAGNVAVRYGGAGKVKTMIDSGYFSGTTDASGLITIPFSGNAVPNVFPATIFNNAAAYYTVVNRQATFCQLKLWTGAGVALTGTAVEIGWEARL